MILSLLAAIAGVVLIAIQVLLLQFQESGICLDEGCQIIDNLTTIDPVYFNLVGLVFFLIVCFGLIRARRGSESWRHMVGVLLLAGLAAEAVLLSFQSFVVQLYCTYCLIVLGLIVLTNVFLGLKQIAKGIIVFSSVMLAFASLDFGSEAPGTDSLSAGTLARFEPAGVKRHYLLFFSSTCNHCETIIEELENSSACAIHFNPVDTITSFTFPGVVFTDNYRPQINRNFLKNLDITEVPVLLSREQEAITIIKGEAAIRAYLRQQCAEEQPDSMPASASNGQSTFTWPVPVPDDGCSILSDCDEPPGTSDGSGGSLQSSP